jgi:hypothetical protein
VDFQGVKGRHDYRAVKMRGGRCDRLAARKFGQRHVCTLVPSRALTPYNRARARRRPWRRRERRTSRGVAIDQEEMCCIKSFYSPSWCAVVLLYVLWPCPTVSQRSKAYILRSPLDLTFIERAALMNKQILEAQAADSLDDVNDTEPGVCTYGSLVT